MNSIYATKLRQLLPDWLRQAQQGEEIVILIVAKPSLE